ncbi:MAG: carbon-nitrogen hydrolase family protein [Ethanoligenens sp.]
MKLQVACVQMEPVLCQVDVNLAKMTAHIETVMREEPQTKLIVFPELITSGYECGTEFRRLAETVPYGASMKCIGDCAKKFGVNVIYGFPERDPLLPDVLFNSVVFIDAQGKAAGCYRKVHLFDTEKQFFRAGCTYPVLDTEFGKIGMMICWDTAFPEVARSYALQGAQLLTVSTNWEKPYAADWDLVTRARAFDNISYLISANRIGFDQTLGFFGRSKIVSPLGAPIAELNEEREGFISAELDTDLPLRLKQEYYTIFKDRRPDTYGEVAKVY